MKVVFDTNIFVSAFALPGGRADQAIRRVINGDDTLYISRPILLELLRILSEKFRHDREQIAEAAVFLSEFAEFAKASRTVRILADEPDNRILECALAASADTIVTGDHAMLALGTFEGIAIISLRDYLDAAER